MISAGVKKMQNSLTQISDNGTEVDMSDEIKRHESGFANKTDNK